MVDFELGLINSIRDNFKDSIINSCYFHYTKLLWNKAKYFGLCKKKEFEKY